MKKILIIICFACISCVPFYNPFAEETFGKTTQVPSQELTPLPTPKAEIQIYYENFEQGLPSLNSWICTGLVATVQDEPVHGLWKMEMYSNASATKIFSTSGYTDIRISFCMGCEGIDPGEYFRIKWTDGSINENILLVQDICEHNGYEHHECVFDLSKTASDNQNFAIVIEILNATNFNEIAFIDKIIISGKEK